MPYIDWKVIYKKVTMKIKCLLCDDIIESKSVHNLVSWKCESCYIDGGSYYAHIGAKDFSQIVKILDDGTEIKGNNQLNNKRKAR